MSRRQEIMGARPKRPPRHGLQPLPKLPPKHYPNFKPMLGSGERFARLKGELSRKGVRDPAALAASIGRKKYGNAGMAALSRGGRRDR